MWSFLRTMKLYILLVVVAVTTTSLSSAIPKPDEAENGHKNRVVDKELSEQQHFDPDGEDHNAEYDHEAFLGKEEAKSFEELTPEESKERLGFIYKKIDKDGNKLVSEEELKQWIKYVQNRYIMEDTERQWKEHEADVVGDLLSWDAYKKKTYGFLDEEEQNQEEDGGYSYRDMMRRDERRWKKADTNNDNALTKEEFANFLHPEEATHMRDVVVDETLEDIDKNKDGVISLEEYIGDMYPEDGSEDEPDWVKSEREQFKTQRDMNGDGNMDRPEILKWIIPDDYDHVETEARHLLREADADKDQMLTVDEVLEKYDLFVGSQATDFGEALTKHDEF